MVTKIVLDTNIIISALGWKGIPHKIFQKCIDGEFQICLSPAILAELEKVLSYKKLKFNQEEREEILSMQVCGISEIKSFLLLSFDLAY